MPLTTLPISLVKILVDGTLFFVSLFCAKTFDFLVEERMKANKRILYFVAFVTTAFYLTWRLVRLILKTS